MKLLGHLELKDMTDEILDVSRLLTIPVLTPDCWDKSTPFYTGQHLF